MRIFNCLTKNKDLIIDNNRCGMYVCGPTVYDLSHLGHARVYLVFDTVVRYLRSMDVDVCYVRNITDIDDKIINKAKESGSTFTEIAEKFTYEFHQDLEKLGCLKPDIEPKATDHIHSIIDWINKLLEKKAAYRASNGDIMFSVGSDINYGCLSKKNVEDLIAGARVVADTSKRDPADFVLWKVAKENEPSWQSRFGKGRPGWHIECTAMAAEYLDAPINMHGGGGDLLFPHHENERAQYEVVKCQQYCNCWMHVGMVEIDNTKMSKSLGNFITIKDMLSLYDPAVIRLFILQTHYRKPLAYSDNGLQEAVTRLKQLDKLKKYETNLKPDFSILPKECRSHVDNFFQAIEDDFNTPLALTNLFALIKISFVKDLDIIYRVVYYLADILGLFSGISNTKVDLKISESEIDEMIQAREVFRLKKDWQSADKIRSKLLNLGIELVDGEKKTTWKRKST